MGWYERMVVPEDRRSVKLLLGTVLATSYNGYDAGVIVAIIADQQFIDYYKIDATRSGLFAIIPWATTALSYLYFGPVLASWLGRLWALRIAILIMFVGVVVQVVPNTFGVLILGRLITGGGFGIVYIASNLYISECSPTKLRGSFVGFLSQFGYQLGTLIAFWTGYGMSTYREPYNIAWRVSNLIQVPIGTLFIILSFWYPESPRWLLEHYPEQPEKALKQLAWLRNGAPTDEHVAREFHELVASREFRKRFTPGYRGLFKDRGLRKRLLYGIYAMSLQQFGGIASVTVYAVLIYQSLGWNSGGQALAINGIQSVLQLLIVFVNTVTVDRFGRRALLLTGFAIQSAALMVLSSLTTSFPNNDNRSAAVAEVAMLFIVGLTYCFSNGPIAPTVATEIFPGHVRERAFGISAIGQAACLIALTQPWPTFTEQVGPRSYWLLFSLNMTALISVYFILPETKGVSLERMDKIFGAIDTVAAAEEEAQSHKKEEELVDRALTKVRTNESDSKERDEKVERAGSV
ncbi:Sugar (and other) transporter-like protein 69 [Elsinoe fawcettii]|nr:Sugar (and other) transporter-like protein 69 [Elsinoe fawcettii]